MQKHSKKTNIDIQSFKFTSNHEWVYLHGNTVVIGVTEIVTNMLGHVIYLDLPNIDDEILTIVPFGELETVDDTYDVNSPFEGDVIEINEALINKLDILSTDPYKKGWLIKMYAEDVTAIDSLMDKDKYEEKFNIELNKRKTKIKKKAPVNMEVSKQKRKKKK